MLPKMLTPKDIQNYLRCSKEYIYNGLFNNPDFPSFKIGSKHYILEDKFIEWLNSRSK